MSKMKLYACGGTEIEGKAKEVELETDGCDFMLVIQRSEGSKKYRLAADQEGNMIVTACSVDEIRLTSNYGSPALKLVSYDEYIDYGKD